MANAATPARPHPAAGTDTDSGRPRTHAQANTRADGGAAAHARAFLTLATGLIRRPPPHRHVTDRRCPTIYVHLDGEE